MASSSPGLPLREAVSHAIARLGSGDVSILVNDDARATPTGLVLEHVVEALPGRRLTCVVAAGTHRANPAARRAHEATHGLHRLGTVTWHDADQPEATAQAMDGRAVLAIGSVEPHWFAGWTGAHKTLTVGVWPRDAITANHAFALEASATACRTVGNPVFEGVAHALTRWCAARDAPVAAIDVVWADGGVLAAAGGAPLETLRAVCPAARGHYVTELSEPVDRLVAHVAPPLSRSLYQALKGIKNHAGAIRDGGAMVLVAPCEDGVGIDHFMGDLRRGLDHAALGAEVCRRGYALGDHKGVRLLELVERRGLRLGLVSAGVPDSDVAACRMSPHKTLQDALTWARQVAPGPSQLTVEDAGQQVTLLVSADA